MSDFFSVNNFDNLLRNIDVNSFTSGLLPVTAWVFLIGFMGVLAAGKRKSVN
jgi:hypothetical protein